jgi:hypothetical protein
MADTTGRCPTWLDEWMIPAGAVPLYALLLGAWLVVAADTARGSATGRLFRPTSPSPGRGCRGTPAGEACAPVLAVGGLGSWAALREAFPETVDIGAKFFLLGCSCARRRELRW